MKKLKLFESFSEDKSKLDDYLLDFTDNGFTIDIKMHGDELFIKGENKSCKTKLEEVHGWYSDLLSKISNDWIILFTKTYFNNQTGNLSFEITISVPLKHDNSININISKGRLTDVVEWIPIDGVRWIENRNTKSLSATYDGIESYQFVTIPGKLKNNAKKSLYIQVFEPIDKGDRRLNKMFFGFGDRQLYLHSNLQKRSGIKVLSEDIEKLISIIENDEINCLGDKTRVLNLLKNNKS